MSHDLTPQCVAERVAAAGRLTRSRWFASEIAVYLGVSVRTVERYRARIRAGAK